MGKAEGAAPPPPPPLEEVGDAEPPVPTLPREGEAGELLALLGQDDQVLVLAHGTEVAVDDTGLEHLLGLDAIEPGTDPRTALGLHELLVRRTRSALRCPESPPTEQRGPLVEVVDVVLELDAADEPVTEEGRLRNDDVGGDVGAPTRLGLRH